MRVPAAIVLVAASLMLAAPTAAARAPHSLVGGPGLPIPLSAAFRSATHVDVRGGIATIAVQVDVEHHPTLRADALRGWLVGRLLDEGYAIASAPEGAHGVVRIRSVGEGLAVEIEGRERRSYAIEQGPDAVVRLEMLHRAVVGVEQVCDPTQPIAAPEPGLALRLSGGTNDALHEALAAAIAESGMTLHAQPLPDDTLVCVERRGALAEVGIGPGADECRAPWLVLDLADESPAALRLAAEHVIAALHTGRGTAEPLDLDQLAGPSELESTPLLERESDGELAPFQGPPRSELRLGGSAGIAVRGRYVDPLLSAGWRMGRLRGLGGRLAVSTIPSHGASVSVLDTRLAVGPDWSLSSQGIVHFQVGLLVGALLHSFSNGSRERNAADLGLDAALPITLGLSRRGRPTRIDIALDPGITTTRWRHRAGLVRTGVVQWERPAWRVGLTIGISHGWRIE